MKKQKNYRKLGGWLQLVVAYVLLVGVMQAYTFLAFFAFRHVPGATTSWAVLLTIAGIAVVAVVLCLMYLAKRNKLVFEVCTYLVHLCATATSMYNEFAAKHPFGESIYIIGLQAAILVVLVVYFRRSARVQEFFAPAE